MLGRVLEELAPVQRRPAFRVGTAGRQGPSEWTYVGQGQAVVFERRPCPLSMLRIHLWSGRGWVGSSL